ncbi:MAG: ribosome biogenesis factor YjgA [Candidatus Sedimenticola sp. (ex Thyasira tokunagai)]
MSDDFGIEGDEDQLVSRTQLKREMMLLQKLGERLVGLPASLWEQFNFSPVMRAALEESKRIKSHNAMRRHVRRLGKLLAKEDAEQVSELFARMDNEHLQDTNHFHRLERWRERLLQGGDEVVNELLDVCPDADRQQIRQLVRQSQKEQQLGKPPAAQRKLFKYLRKIDIE